jgi:hypothetical protein
MFRQIGGTLGVATFVAILGTPATGDVLGAFDETRAFMAICAGVAAVALVAISRVGAGAPVALSRRPAPAES